MPYLEHILLVDHHAVGLGQKLFQQWMLVVHRLGMMEAVDVLTHHARARHTWPNDGTRRHQGLVVGAPQLSQQATHGRTLDVETAAGLSLEQLAANQFILFQRVDLVDVDADATVAFHHLHRVADMGDAALTEDVNFNQPDLLSGIHIVLCRREAFGWQVKGGVVGNGILGNEHAAGMDGTLAREVAEARGKYKDVAPQLALTGEGLGVAFHLVNFTFGQTKHLAQLTTKRVILESDRCTEQGHIFPPIFFEDMRDDLVAVAPREVEVEVGRAAALGIEETLKVQV